MDGLPAFTGSLGTLVRSTVVVAGTVVLMGVLHRLLQHGNGTVGGRRFRNQLIVFGASILVVLLVILALPITGEMRGQLLGLFGIVMSATIALSSSTFPGNAMAGIMLKTVRNFRSGDFVSVGEHFGRVSERGLFHTEIQTPDRDLTTLPNLYLATTPLTVTYMAAALLTDVKTLLGTRSRLRAAMIDALHDGGVEIVSPSFRNIRTYEGERVFKPAAPRPQSRPAPVAAPVAVVFDKAETAETHDTLRKRRKIIENELKEARQEAKNADSNEAAERVAALRGRLDRLDAASAAGQAELDEEEGPF